MKKILLTFAVLLAVGSSAPVNARPQHRHTPRTEAVDQKKAAMAQDAASAGEPEGIEAYSDTSSVAANDTSAVTQVPDMVDDADRFNPGRFNDPFSWFGYMCTTGLGSFIAVCVLLFFLLFLLLPFIIVFLVLRYIVRRHNDRVRLAEKAMENGCQLTEDEMPLSKKSPDYMWRRGVRNVSIGVGVMLFFWCLGATPLVGIGGLVACMGAGQMFMARYNYNTKFRRGGRESRDDNGFDDFSGDINDLKFDDMDKK